MSNKAITKAVILAAGRGTRMGGITQEIPKPMLPIKGRPMLDHILERLQQSGISHFLIVVGYHGEVIEQHFVGTKPLPLQANHVIEFVRQNPVNGTGSGALLAQTFAAGESFLLTYGDILCDPVEYSRATGILSEHEQCVASVAVKAVDDPWQGAAVYEVNAKITRIIEKPPKGSSTTHWNSAGFYVFRPQVFEYLSRLEPSARGEYELTSALDRMLADGLDLRISAIEGAWRDVGRPEDLAALNN